MDNSEKQLPGFISKDVEDEDERLPTDTNEMKAIPEPVVKRSKMVFEISDVPPVHTSLLLGLQHFLAVFFGNMAAPLILSSALCMADNPDVVMELFGVTFFTNGVCTILQILFGVRLPIMQGATFTLLIPVLSYLQLSKNQCPNIQESCWTVNITNNTGCIEKGSTEYDNIWKSRMLTIQGSIMTASLVEIVFGLTGVVGLLVHYIGPLTICPTISLIGLSLFWTALHFAEQNWPVCIMTMVILILFSQYLSSVNLPIPTYTRDRGCTLSKYPVFQSYSIILAILVSWLICFLLTITDAIPDDDTHWAHSARTDINRNLLDQSPWFNFFWPGKYGTPRVDISLVVGLMAGLVSSVIESVGDYNATARMCRIPTPPKHAQNRGIVLEGCGCLIAGLLGTGGGTTSYSQNAGLISLTKVASRAVTLYAAGLMIFVGIFNKFGVLFVTIPQPVIGAAFFILFGMIVGIGLSHLQFVDMNSSRNQFVLGFSFIMGVSIPEWTITNSQSIQTGLEMIDDLIIVLLSTSMFVGGMLALFLDNTLPGESSARVQTARTTDRQSGHYEEIFQFEKQDVYDPMWIGRLTRFKLFRYLPICPVQHDSEI